MNVKRRFILFILFFVSFSFAVTFDYDFNDSKNIEQFREFEYEGCDIKIETDSLKRRYISLKNQQPSKYCRLRIRRPFIFDENLAISFAAKATTEGARIDYLAIGLFSDNQNYFFGKTSISSNFKEVKFYLSQLRQVKEYSSKKIKIDYVDIYIRATNPASLNMILDDIKLEKDILTTVSYNSPPLFNWERIGQSVLQYSKDIRFETGTVTANTEYNFHTPDSHLSAGSWYWRVRGKDAEKWSPVRCIEIPLRHHSYVAEAVNPGLLEQKSHPRIPALQDDLAKKRGDIRNEFLELREYQVPDDTRSLADSGMERWLWYSKVKRMTVMPAGKKLQRIADIYVLLGDDDVRELLLDWTWEIMEWDPQGGSSPSGGDIPAYHILRGLNNSYDALYNDITDEQREELKEVIITRALDFEELLGNPFPVNTKKEFNNHAWLQALVLCETGLVLDGDYERAYEWVEYTRQLMIGMFLCGLGFQGESNEGLAYWGYGEKFLQQYASLLRRVTGNNLFDHPWLNQASKFPIYCAVKNSWAVSFADTGRPNHGYKAVPEQEGQFQAIYNNVNSLTKKLSKECEDPYGIWYCGDYSNSNISPKPPVDINPSTHYEHIGWAIQNTDLVDGSEGVTVALRSGPYWSAHQHEDQNGFVINAYGDKIAIDSGYYDFYGSDHFLEYSIRSEAHNVILVNGKGQDSKKPGADGKITDYFSSSLYGLISADSSDESMYDGQLEKWIRHILFIKPRYIIIYDELKSNLPAKYDWLLHSVNEYFIDNDNNEFSFDTSNASLKGKFLMPSDVDITQQKGYSVLPVGLDDSPIRKEDVVDEWTLKAGVKNEDILALLQINRLENIDQQLLVEELSYSEDMIAFRIKSESKQHIVIINKNGNNIDFENIRTNADNCVITIDDNMILKDFFVNNATFLTYNNSDLFRIDEETDHVNISGEIKSDLTVYSISVEERNRFHLASDKQRVFSEKGRLNYDNEKGIEVEGFQIITTGTNAEEYFHRKLPSIYWAETELQGYSPDYVNGLNYWWGRVYYDSDVMVRISTDSEDSKVFIDDYQVVANGENEIKIDKGYSFVQVSSKKEILRLKIEKE